MSIAKIMKTYIIIFTISTLYLSFYFKNTPLHLAVNTNKKEIIKVLLNHPDIICSTPNNEGVIYFNFSAIIFLMIVINIFRLIHFALRVQSVIAASSKFFLKKQINNSIFKFVKISE